MPIASNLATMDLFQDLKSRYAEQCIARLIRRNTIVGPERIQNLSHPAQRIESERIPDDVIEWAPTRSARLNALARSDTQSPLLSFFGSSIFSQASRNHDYRYTR